MATGRQADSTNRGTAKSRRPPLTVFPCGVGGCVCMVQRARAVVTKATPAASVWCQGHLKPCKLCGARHLDQAKRFRCDDCGRRLCDLQSKSAFDHTKRGARDKAERCIAINIREL